MADSDHFHHQWAAAQSIHISIDLIAAAKQHLSFLSSVDQNPHLYQGPALKRAIHRYQNCWLPLLAAHGNNDASTSLPWLPPLDCAWIWHCHRLNPDQYTKDCESLFGKLIDCPLFELGPSVKDEATAATRQLWESVYINEDYSPSLAQLSDPVLGNPITGIATDHVPESEDLQTSPDTNKQTRISFDLEAAVTRQRFFFYQVSRSYMSTDSFLKVAEQRYKGFLHLFRNTNLQIFFVPTYDIDLMWHSHQLCPLAYRNDMLNLLGKLLNHDDTDSDRSEGQKLDKGFMQTQEHWEQTYGTLYQRAGAMYRGEPPSPVPPPPSSINAENATVTGFPVTEPQEHYLQRRELIQVSLAVLEARNIHIKHKGKLFVRLQMKDKCKAFKLDTEERSGSSSVEWRQSWDFETEISTKGLHFELRVRYSNIVLRMGGSDIIGWVDVSWQSLLESPTLSLEQWISLKPSVATNTDPVLSISVSITPPVSGPFLLRSIKSPPTDDKGHMDTRGSTGKWLTKTVVDHRNVEVFIVRTRYLEKAGFFSKQCPENKKMIYVHHGGWQYHGRLSTTPTASDKIVGTAQQLAENGENDPMLSVARKWSLFGSEGFLTVYQGAEWTKPTLELTGNFGYPVRLECGRKLRYEVRDATENEEIGFVTVVRYTPDAPSGKATALFNWRTGALEVLPEEDVLLVILLSSTISMSVFYMRGLKVHFKRRIPPPRRNRGDTFSDEWGSVILGRKPETVNKNILPFYSWWGMSPVLWTSTFYASADNSGGIPAGVCGAGACGASGCGAGSGGACGGSGGGGCGGGGGGCGGGGGGGVGGGC